MCVAYLQIDQENKLDKEKTNNESGINDKELFAAQSRFKKSAATAALLLAKNVVIQKEED